MKNIFLYLCLLLSFASCKKDEVETTETTMVVNYYQQNCMGVAPQKCYMVQEGKQIGAAGWSLLYENIRGFTYEEGYMYTLQVKKVKIANPPQDGSSVRYTLVKILSKEPA